VTDYFPVHDLTYRMGMNTVAWKMIIPNTVSIDILIPTQSITLKGLIELRESPQSYSGDKFPHVVDFFENLYISDGHHRIAKAICNGLDVILARILIVRENNFPGLPGYASPETSSAGSR
jgi:hypothetical protein